MTLMEESLTARMQALASRVAAIRPAADVEARRAERDALERDATVQALRARWNAPRRQLRASPVRDGPWGERLDRLQNQRYADLTDTLLTSSQDRPSFESSPGPFLISR